MCVRVGFPRTGLIRPNDRNEIFKLIQLCLKQLSCLRDQMGTAIRRDQWQSGRSDDIHYGRWISRRFCVVCAHFGSLLLFFFFFFHCGSASKLHSVELYFQRNSSTVSSSFQEIGSRLIVSRGFTQFARCTSEFHGRQSKMICTADKFRLAVKWNYKLNFGWKLTETVGKRTIAIFLYFKQKKTRRRELSEMRIFYLHWFWSYFEMDQAHFFCNFLRILE